MEDLRIGASMLKETMDEEAQTQEPMQRSKPTVLRSWPAVRSHTDGEAGPQGAPTNSTRRGVASINNATGSTGRLPSSWHPTPGAFSIFPSGVDRLAGEDGYAAWAIRMKRAFEYCGLTDLIEGSFVKPLPGGALVPVWQRMNSYARTYITQSITDNILENISDLYDAKKIWDRLEQEYSQVNSNAITRWFSQLRHPMRLDENVLDHVTNFQRTRDRLATARFIIPDSTAAGILLSTLLYEPNHPQSWDHFVKKFEMSNTTTLSNLVGEIRQENHRRSSTTSTTNYYPRFIESKITPLEHDGGASGKNRCGNCKREGHDWSECSLSHGGREAQKRCQHCKRDGHDWPQCFLPGGGREGVWQNKAMGNKR